MAQSLKTRQNYILKNVNIISLSRGMTLETESANYNHEE